MSRLGDRRNMIVQETNAIHSAYLRLDLLPQSDQPGMRQLFREYLDARLRVYDSIESNRDPVPALRQAVSLQHQIWRGAMAARAHDASRDTTQMVLPAINEMIDITTARAAALRSHTPLLIMVLLFGVALLSSLLAGHVMSKQGFRSMLHAVLFAATISLTIYTVLDLDNPQRGLIRLASAEHIMRDLHLELEPMPADGPS
jgi:hypothetical protein